VNGSAYLEYSQGKMLSAILRQRRTTMTYEKLLQIWNSYQEAWADVAVGERERLLAASVTGDVVYTNPINEGQGLGNLVKHVGDFQVQFPGAHFRTNKLLVQHGQLLAEWTMFNKDGSELLTAHSYARFDEQGLLSHLAGFWKV
jgi:SnoaL-like domain